MCKLAIWVVLPLAFAMPTPTVLAAGEEGIALAIVYDTSGSMAGQVRDQAGRNAPKYVIANRALTAIIDRLQKVSANVTAGAPRKIEAGLFVFNDKGTGVVEAVPFGPFNAAALRQWTKTFARPDGSTPLGEAVRAAGEAVTKSKLSRKHVLVLTDGMNTSGPEPAVIIPRLHNDAAKSGGSIEVHFVAFDVAAKIFDPVKKLGVTVMGASDELQLNTQLTFILEEKILLEAEEPAKPATK